VGRSCTRLVSVPKRNLVQVAFGSQAAQAIAQATTIDSDFGHGRLTTLLAVQAATTPQF
jgi:hypothetical protein